MGEVGEAGHAVRRLISRACELKHRRVHELLGQLGLGRGEPFVLHALWDRDGMTQSELADALRRSPSTITKTVQHMEQGGLVERRADVHDERVSRVFVTDAGRVIRPAIEAAWEQLNQEMLAGFSAEELALLQAYLQRVCGNLGQAHRSRP
jgi:MarR family transcriptional regulator, organic hydroperoxide resistance regulator